MNLEFLLSEMEKLSRAAGEFAFSMRKSYGETQYKNPKDIVTTADLKCNELIYKRLQELMPEANMWTEESPYLNQNSDWTWVADPIDGTVNFSRQMPMWGNAIALLYQNKPILGVSFIPSLNEMYVAQKGQGAFCNGEKISVSAVENLESCLVSNGDFNVGDFEKNNQNNLKMVALEAKHCMRVKCIGSAIVESCFVAAGRLDAYVMTYSHPWDIAAGSLLVQEAGGKVSFLNGSPLEMVDEAELVMSNSHIHEKFLKLI